MDARVRKMGNRVGMDLAQLLFDAGLDTPRKVKAADDKDLEAIKGIGKAKKDKIRERIPKFKK
jgi:ERCC4-type nuclease